VQTVPVRVGSVEVLVEVVPVAGSQQTSVTDRLAGTFERAQVVIEEIAASTARTIRRLTSRSIGPDQVEVEFGLKISAKGDLIVAAGSGEASLRIMLTYGSAPAEAAAAVSGEAGAGS
jgi:hypothetical protein